MKERKRAKHCCDLIAEPVAVYVQNFKWSDAAFLQPLPFGELLLAVVFRQKSRMRLALIRAAPSTWSIRFITRPSGPVLCLLSCEHQSIFVTAPLIKGKQPPNFNLFPIQSAQLMYCHCTNQTNWITTTKTIAFEFNALRASSWWCASCLSLNFHF